MALRVKLISYDGSGILEIPSNPYPMYPHPERLNCISLDSAAGDRLVFDGGPTRINSSIIWKAITYEKAREYEDFLLNRAKLGRHSFTIICPEYIDFGLGKGKPIIEAFYSGPPSLKEVIIPRDDAGLFYDIELPYMFVRNS